MKNFKNFIRRQFGVSILNCVKYLEKEERSSVKLKNDIIFLKRCRKNDLTPVGLRINNFWNHIPKSNKLLQNMEKTLLKQQIYLNFSKLKRLEDSINIKRRRLTTLPQDLRDHIFKYIDDGKMTFNLQTKRKHINKIENLLKKKVKLCTGNNSQTTMPTTNSNEGMNEISRSVLNLSHRQLDRNETRALELGLNFALPYFKHKELIVEAGINIELCMEEFDTNETFKNHIRSGIARILHSEVNKADKSTKDFDWLKPICNNLRNDQSITIVPADKGNLTVVMTKTEYDNKIDTLLLDPSYSILDNDPTSSLETEINNLSKNLLKMKKLDKSQHHYISPSNSKIPRFYGLPKVHKPDLPFRPIVDFRSSPSYNLAHFLNKILKPVTTNFPTHIKNSYEFAKSIKNFVVPPNHELVSFDVISLFTRVPVETTLKYIRKRLNSSTNWKTITKLNTEEIMKLLRITVNSNYFTWNGRIYKQKDGTPMGSPVSPEFAEFSLQDLEEEIVLKHPDIKFFKRFVDDCFACIPTGSKERILQDLNSYHPNLQFTCESETDMSISFLDLLISRDENGNLHRQVYRKQTHTGRYLSYNSFPW